MHPGTELGGRYVLEEMLDSGGMGDVWRGADTELRRPVAVKVMRGRLNAPDAVIRFEREARVAARLKHPGITVVFDVGSQDGRPFIVMELLDGRDLAMILADRRGGLPVGEVLSLGIQASEALRAAHGSGVIHRDVKPGNLFLQRNGVLKLCDFGIARAADLTAGLTLPGTAFGTARYMSPEQWRGESIDERSDLYSFGCVLYELLTGEPPFTDGPPEVIMSRHLNVPPVPPRALRPDIPPELDELVLSLLAKDPAGRPHSAGQVSAALRRIMPGAVSSSNQAGEPFQGTAEGAADSGHAEAEDAGIRAPRVLWRERGTIGIDLGTTRCVAAFLESTETIQSSRPVMVVNAEGVRSTPSVVAFAEDGEVLVGEPAEQYAGTTGRIIRSVMRHMGTGWSVPIDGKTFTPQQITAYILKKLALDAEAQMGEPVTTAVISVPACFGQTQRQAVREAARIAGLNVEHVVSQSSLAAKEYLRANPVEEETVLVFGLGGGSLSIAVAEIATDDDGLGFVEVLAAGGDTCLGGDDWDQRIVDWLVAKSRKHRGPHLTRDMTAMMRLRQAAERAKIALSGAPETTISLPGITSSRRRPGDLDVTLTRSEFQQMTSDLIDRCRTALLQVVSDSKVAVGDIGKVLLVGGAARMSAVAALITEVTGKEPAEGLDPDECIAAGASCGLRDALLNDRYPHSLGIEASAPLGDTGTPAIPHPGYWPKGAAGGLFTRVVEKNSRIPTAYASEIFTTGGDNQPSVLISVYEGEREIAAYNRKLGMFELTGLAPAPRGIPQIQVGFDVDIDGFLEVSAKDLSTGRRTSWSISGDAWMREVEDRQATEGVESYGERYHRKRMLAEARNLSTTLIRSSAKLLSENVNMLPGSMISEVSSSIAALNTALEGTDAEEIKLRMEQLSRSAQKMGSEIYTARTATTRTRHKR